MSNHNAYFDYNGNLQQIFHSTHYSGEELILQFGTNEPWKKVLGPVFFYLNSLVNGTTNPIQRLWEDAKQEVQSFNIHTFKVMHTNYNFNE